MRALHRLLLALTLILTIVSAALPPHAVSAAPARQDSTPITAKLDSAVKPDAFLPNQPLIVRFSVPVDPESAPMPVLTDPYLIGESAWSEDDTLLTFTPEGGFRPGITYQVYLNPDLTGAKGEVFDPLPHWTLKTLAAPHLVSINPPAGMINGTRPAIEINFDQPMNEEWVERSLTMTPAGPFTTGWRENKLQIFLREPLIVGEHYQFALSADATNRQGVSLAQDVRWDYWVEPLRATVSVLRGGWVEVNFNYPIDAQKSGTPFQIEPEVAGTWSWSDKNKARFALQSHLPIVPEYTLSFTGPLIGKNGDELAAPEPLSFVPPVPITNYGPVNQENRAIDGQPEIWMFFSRPVDHASVEAAFSTAPQEKGEFRWEKEKLIFTPTGSYSEDIDVTVKLDTTAKDANGDAMLLEPFTWTFHVSYWGGGMTQLPVSFGQHGPNMQVLSAQGRRAVQYSNTYGHKEPAIFSLYRIEAGDFAPLYRRHFGMLYPWVDTSDMTRLIDTNGLEKIKTWPVAYELEVQETLLPEGVTPGTYLLDIGLESGVYDQIFLMVTDYRLVLKRSGERIWVWATDFDNNNAEGLRVRLYTESGELMREGDTDAEGIFSTSLPKDSAPMLVTAMDEDGDITAVGVNDAWQGYTGAEWWFGPYDEPDPARYYRGYLYTERPIYQPGQEIFFKAIVRGDDDIHYTLPDEGTPVSVRLLDARGNEVQTQQLLLNAFGTASGSFVLGEGAMLGDYTLEASIKGETFTRTLMVQRYRKPEYEVDITLGANAYVMGDTVKVDIDTRYFFGQPVANASITADIYGLLPIRMPWWEDVNFSTEPLNPGEFDWAEVISSPKSKTDANGHAELNIRAENPDRYYWYCRRGWRSSLEECYMGIEVTATDASGQAVTASKAVRVYNSPVKYSIDVGGWQKQPGKAFDAVITVTDIEGNPVANHDTGIIIKGYSWDSWNQREIDRVSGTTGPDGKLTIPVTLGDEGYFEVAVNDSQELRDDNETSTWVYVTGKSGRWNSDNYSAFKIEAERTQYKPYEKAKLLITSAFDGPALLTFERGQVIHTRPVMLTAPLTEVEVEIIPEDAPNIFVKLNAWQGEYETLAQVIEQRGEYLYDIGSLRDARLYQTQVELLVDAGANRLNIDIQPDEQQYAPRGEATLTVKVTDAQDRPVQAELSVALVDEALFSLVEDRSGSIFDAFYGRRAHNVVTYNSMALRRYIRWDAKGGGGGGDAPPTGPNPRSNFPDTAVWLPDVHTDENGIATVQVTLPDNLTSWRVIVKAVTTGTQVGDATTNIITQKEAIVRPLLPQELVVGDTVSLTAMVHNYGTEERTFVAMLSADGLTREGEPSQPVTVEAGGVQPVVWQVSADRAGPVIVTMGIMAPGGIEDAVELPLEVHERSVREVVSQSGEFTGAFTGILALPPNLLPSSTAEVTLSRSIGGSMMEGLEYLTGNPYGCVEQTMSRALPNAVVGRALSKLGVNRPGLVEELPALIDGGLQRLYGYQHQDGGWGWWYDDPTDVYQSAWVVFGLAVTREAGYPVEEKVIERGAEYLKDQLENNVNLSVRTRAYVLYSLARAGYGDREQTLAMLEHLYGLDPFSQAGLALALEELGEKEAALRVVEMLDSRVVVDGARAYWALGSGDGSYHDKTMSSDVRTTALALSAYVQIAPDHERISQMVQYLMGQRNAQGWGTTNETAYTLLALTDYLDHAQQNAGVIDYEVLLNDAPLTSGTLEPGAPALTIPLPMDQLHSGPNTVTIQQVGDSKLYYTITGSLYQDLPSVDPAGTLEITRAYLDPNTNQPLKQVQVGQLVKVQLKIQRPKTALSYVMIEDHLPAGFEAINEKLNNTSHDANHQEFEENYWEWVTLDNFQWQQFGYNNKEIRGGTVTFFLTSLPAGKDVMITYMARVTQNGSFTALPAEISAMYDLATWGRSGSTGVVIDSGDLSQ